MCIAQILPLSCNWFNWKVFLWHSRWRSCKGKGIDIKTKIPAACSAWVKSKTSLSYCSLFHLSWFLASRAAVSSFSWHPTQENHMLTISPSGECSEKLSLQGMTRVMRNVRGLVVQPFSYYVWLTSCLTGKQHLQVTIGKKGGLVDLPNCPELLHLTSFSVYSQWFVVIFQDTYKIVQFLKEYQLWVLLLWIKIKLL